MFAPIGPGRYRATRAMTSSNVGAERADQRPHRRALHLEDPDRVPALEQLEGLGVVQGDVVDVDPLPRALLDQLEAPLDDGQVAKPRKSILRRPSSSTACISNWVTVSALVTLALDGDDVGEWLRGDHDGGGVDRVLTAQPLEPRAASTTFA
jgi:hypothetical protein